MKPYFFYRKCLDLTHFLYDCQPFGFLSALKPEIVPEVDSFDSPSPGCPVRKHGELHFSQGKL